jgi:hypothetical protein
MTATDTKEAAKMRSLGFHWNVRAAARWFMSYVETIMPRLTT